MQARNLSLTHIIRPNSENQAKPPALIMLHGYGSNEEDLFSFASELPGDLFIISLQAPFTLEPFGYAWYAINFEAEKGKWSDLEQASKSRELIREFLEEAIAAYDLDATRISLLGFSQGSILSYALALSYPEKIKSVVALSGYINAQILVEGYREKDHSSLEIYASHGQMDMVIPPAWAQQTPPFLDELGIPHRYEEYPVGHGVSPANFESFKKWLQERY
ncbi:phospholipase/carboxylesterase [Robiginitalea myxolifaciens]|uniref:Phospholipase/carboxylesterase n=1 Tax=Robiginitalea myxolifaciens TaxID=400055 RepID=A0A1I6GVD0_9FLAO|nr:alpha/beta hydrolase-fold protein [Robiginitalea myxolifaciens]SFR46138.1 phospholipase/carboxylesterase [Robiginitalea myxolifaciens]